MDTLATAGKISEAYKIAFVDDGSRDNTWNMIEELCRAESVFAGVRLSRNRGHQNALLAGLFAVMNEADAVVSIDADLQDDIDAIDNMIDGYLGGCDIVYGVRQNREKDSFFKRSTAEGFYKLLQALGCDIVFNHADYRLMSSRAIQALTAYSEQGLFLRGLVPMLGYKTSSVYYTRSERQAGESKYPLKRMLALALDGVASLSLKPLRIIMAVGCIMLFLSAILLILCIVALCTGHGILDWKIITFSIWAVGGLLMLALGIVGEYVGRTFIETKHRPRFNIETISGLQNIENIQG